MRKYVSIIVIAVLLVLSGCNTLAPMVFGFREINGYDAEQCEKFYRKLPKDFVFTGSLQSEEIRIYYHESALWGKIGG